MSILAASIIINRPSPDVFSGLTDFSRWPRWQGGLARVERVSPGPLQVGSQFRQIRMGRNATESISIMEVTHLVQNEILSLKSPSLPLAWQGSFMLESAGDGTRLALRFEIQATGLVGLLSDLIIRLTLQQELKTFKAMVEAG
jgi:hypothetical protein